MSDEQARQAYYRLASARHRLGSHASTDALTEALHGLATHCLAVAHLETDQSRTEELEAVAAQVEDLADRIGELAGRAWAVTRGDWTRSEAADA